jgi:uncharacterized protein involved in outer membrane biogenesis
MRKLKLKRVVAVIAVAAVLLVAGLAIAVRLLLGGDRIKAAIEAQASAALGRPVAIETAVPRIFPRVSLDLGNVTVGAAREVTFERIRLSTGLRAILDRRVEDASVSVERSRVDVRWALALLDSLVNAPRPAAPSVPAFIVDSIGSIAFRDVTLDAGVYSMRVEMDSSLAGGDRFTVDRLQAKSAQTSFDASGEIASLASGKGRFTIDADNLDLDELMAFLTAATPAGSRQIAAGAPPPQATPGAAPYDFVIDVRAKQGRALGAALANLTTTCRVSGGAVVLDDLHLDVFGGRHRGRGAFFGASEPRYEWRGTMEGLDVPQVAAYAGAPGSITGRLAGSVNLVAPGADPLEAMRRARGSARVAIADGKVPGLQIVRTVVLAFGKPSGAPPEGSGEAFTRVTATLAVSGQQVSTRDLTFNSRDFDMTGEGSLSLASQAIDFRTDVVLSRELSAQAGRDLYRLARDGERIVLPARITGTVAAPSVFIDVQSALQRALRNKVDDEVKRLFDRFRKQIIR